MSGPSPMSGVRIALAAIALASFALLGLPAPSPASTRPNIIVIMTDDQDYKSLARMPYLTSLPGGKWIEFSQSYTNFPLCCPSRSTFLTGQYSHHHLVQGNAQGNMLTDTNTLATWLQSSGYTTGLVGKYLNNYPWQPLLATSIPPGWSQWFGFVGDVGYKNYVLNENGLLVSYGDGAANYSTDVLRAKAESFVSTAQEPFFAWFVPKAPHASHLPAQRHNAAFAGQTWHTPSFNEADVSDKPAWVQNLPLLAGAKLTGIENRERKAAASLLAVDEAIQGLVNALTARGVLDNTVLIFTSDNGYAWGDHRYEEKNCTYDQCVRVPLLIRYPALAGNVSDSRLVSNVDLAPTIADLAQVTPGLTMDGVSLKPVLDGQSPTWRTSLLIRANGNKPTPSWAVRTATYKYVEYSSGEKELYDLALDAYELANVAGQPAYAAVQSQLAVELIALRGF